MDVRVAERKARPLRNPEQAWIRFAGQMMETRDIDPIYPVLKALNERDASVAGGNLFTEEDTLWRTLCYTALYHLGASEVLWDATWEELAYEGSIDSALTEGLASKAGIERRGLRSHALLERHLASLLDKRERFGSFGSWLRTGHVGDPREDWRRTLVSLEAVAFNGRWASFKTCDILVETHGWPLEAPDAGHRFSSGPRHGLGQLFDDGIMPWAQSEDLPVHTDQSNEAIEQLDFLTSRVQRDLWAEGVPVKVAEVETLLCNWHALRHGHYYVGHDIDEMLERVLWVPESHIRDRLLEARRAALPVQMLGEVQGWAGRRRELMGVV
jgi:hypothetical protein